MALFLGSLLLLVTSQVMASCPDRDAIANLDVARLVGLWHNVKEPDVSYPGSENIKCTHSFLRQGEDGAFRSRYMFLNTTDGHYHSTGGILRKSNPDGTDGKFDGEFGEQHWSAKYYVLDTDYDNYAVVWLCRAKPDGQEGNLEMSVVMSRQRTLPEEHRAAANSALPDGDYRLTDQSDCPDHDHDSHAGHGHEHGDHGHRHAGHGHGDYVPHGHANHVHHESHESHEQHH